MRALLLIDIQNDFLPAGALPVPEGNQVVAVANRLMDQFDLVIATQDWHPADHGSFAANHAGQTPGAMIDLNGLPQILWPVHCVQGTPGAELHPRLNRARIARIFQKGLDPEVDSYSGFFDNGRRSSTGLAEYLRGQGVTDVYICGLATDYCVKATALDAVGLRFKTHLLEDGCRGVELREGDMRRAVEEMRQKGVVITP